MSFQALYKGSRLIIGNPDGNVGIITLWTKASEIAKKIDKNNYAVLGQLFSAERGLDLLVRNLLANPQIQHLIITGVDFSRSGIVLMDFFEKGFHKGKTDITEKPCWRVNSEYEGYIDLDIPEEDLNQLRASIHAIKVQDITKFDFSSLKEPKQLRKKKEFIKKEEQTIKYVGEDIGYIVRGKTIGEAWLKILDTILKFGKINATHYDDQQKEVINMLSIITEEDPHNFKFEEYFPGDEKHIKEYIPRITRDVKGGIHQNEYTYGSRMRSWFNIDQVKGAVAKLTREPISRAVVISLWDQNKDLTIGGSPCLNHIWLRIRDNKLHMTAIFRSHDMFEGYPENAFGLRSLQEEVRQQVISGLKEQGRNDEAGIKLGSMVILSQSAHIYDDSWERCQKIVEKYIRRYQWHMNEFDPRGNLIITIGDENIIVEHTSPEKETLGIYKAKTAIEMRDILIRENIISLIPHALDIGIELMKAELAIAHGLEYLQDNPIELQRRKR
ncbi:hypothetical protein HYV81_05650 [Candidatus Woesearchaeota archaeon]|nr:hypothetical protein [Candidatus Woesearchaeota archaeon]